MNIYTIKMEDITNKNFPTSSVYSAKRIWPHANIDYVASRNIGFSVKDIKYDSIHSVIYFSQNPYSKKWSCDCKWFSLKRVFCKHILAVMMALEMDKEFLPKVERKFVSPSTFYPEQCEK